MTLESGWRSTTHSAPTTAGSRSGGPAGAPQWAARGNRRRGTGVGGLGTLNGATQTVAAVYAASTADFHDITSGSTQFQSAGTGYDWLPGAVARLPICSFRTSGLWQQWHSQRWNDDDGYSPWCADHFTAQVISTSEINLSWSASSGASGYNVYELESGQAVLVGSLGSSATSFAVGSLSAGTTYSFEVTAFNSAGSTATNWLQATTSISIATVAAPSGVIVTATSSTVGMSLGTRRPVRLAISSTSGTACKRCKWPASARTLPQWISVANPRARQRIST